MTLFHLFALAIFLIVPLRGLHASEDAPPISEMSPEQKKLVQNSRLTRLCNHSAVQYEQPDGIEYVPGIDAKGNFIVAPDIGVDMSSNDFPMYIPIEIDLLERFNLDVPLGIIADAEVAGIQIYADGKVTYNGHDISGNVQSFCSEHDLIKPQENKAHPVSDNK
jgi:hypothetical protein